MLESWSRHGAHLVHAWEVGPTRAASGVLAVVIPGLGLPSYTFRMVSALAARGMRCVLLDLPGFGSGLPRAVEPTIEGIGDAAARWILGQSEASRVVVVGHSTGAQAALTAALLVQSELHEAGLVMAGPTFVPRHRQLLRLMAATPLAYRRDSPRELKVMPDLARGRLAVLAVLRSGMRDAPECRLPSLRMPLTLTAGLQDAYAPRWWLDHLAACAVQSPAVQVVALPGSHNNPFTRPEELCDVIEASAPAL